MGEGEMLGAIIGAIIGAVVFFYVLKNWDMFSNASRSLTAMILLIGKRVVSVSATGVGGA